MKPALTAAAVALLCLGLLAACRPAAAGPTAASTLPAAQTTPAAVASAPATGAPGATAPPSAQPPTAAPAAPTAVPTDEGPFELLAPNPLLVTPVLDAGQAVTGLIPAAGGSLTALAADGSVFTLTIPAGALLNEQQIVLTPLLGVEGHALSGGFAAGVSLAPEGLQLLEAATLTIVPASPIPAENELSFAAHGADNEALLFPLVPAAGAATFRLSHFSEYYLAHGGEADRERLYAHPPSDAGDQYLQQIQALIAAQRLALIMGEAGDPEFDAKVAALARSYLKQVLLPQVAHAEQSDDWRFICRVINAVLGFQRTLEMLGSPPLDVPFDHKAITDKLLARQGGLLVAHAEALCRGNHRLLAWTYVLRVARTQMVRQADYGVSLANWYAACPQPALTFSGRITRTMVWPYAGNLSRLISDSEAWAEVPLRFDPGEWAFVGEAPLNLMVFDANSTHGVSSDTGNRYCDVFWAPQGANFRVEKLTVNANQMDCSDDFQPEADAGLALYFDPGLPSENWSADCSVVGSLHRLREEDALAFHQPWHYLFRWYRREQITKGQPTPVEGVGWVFNGPSTLQFADWRFSPDRSSAYAVIVPYSKTPACPECARVDEVEETLVELR